MLPCSFLLLFFYLFSFVFSIVNIFFKVTSKIKFINSIKLRSVVEREVTVIGEDEANKDESNKDESNKDEIK